MGHPELRADSRPESTKRIQCEAANSAFVIRLRAFVDGFIQLELTAAGSRHHSNK